MKPLHAHISQATHPVKELPEVNMFLHIQWSLKPKNTTPAALPQIEETAERFCELAGKDMYFIKAPTRRREFVIYRQALAYYLKKYTKATLRQIGDFLGGQDHTTVINSCRKVEDDIERNEGYKSWIERLDPFKNTSI